MRGREIECGVLEFEDGPRASVPAEIPPVTAHDFYDFEAKYIDSATGLVPAPLTEEQTAEVQRLAVAAFDATSCEGLVRADFFLTEDGTFVINEIKHPAGVHPDLHVPAHVAGERRQLPGAGRPADPGRVDPLDRTALRDPEGPGTAVAVPAFRRGAGLSAGRGEPRTWTGGRRGAVRSPRQRAEDHGAGAENHGREPRVPRGTGRGVRGGRPDRSGCA